MLKASERAHLTLFSASCLRCHVPINSSDVYRGPARVVEMEAALLLPPLIVDPRDPWCIDRLKAFLGRQEEEEEGMFSRLRLEDDGGLGKSSATEKEV